MLSGFMVVACHNLDDLPIAMCKSLAMARIAADEWTMNQSQRAAKAMGRDLSGFVGCVDVWKFENGIFVDVVYAATFEAEEC